MVIIVKRLPKIITCRKPTLPKSKIIINRRCPICKKCKAGKCLFRLPNGVNNLNIICGTCFNNIKCSFCHKENSKYRQKWIIRNNYTKKKDVACDQCSIRKIHYLNYIDMPITNMNGTKTLSVIVYVDDDNIINYRERRH